MISFYGSNSLSKTVFDRMGPSGLLISGPSHGQNFFKVKFVRIFTPKAFFTVFITTNIFGVKIRVCGVQICKVGTMF